MAISVMDGFDYGGQDPNFTRDLFDTIADMVVFSENYLPPVFECNVKEDGNRYRYNVSNAIDPELGKWRLVGGGSSDLTNYYNKTEVDELLEPIQTKADDNETHIGNMTTLVVDTWTDLVTAINALYNSFMSSIVYKDKKMVLTYRNGTTAEIDVSAVITDTGIDEFKNVTTADIEDGQALVYDNATSKWTNKTIDLAKVLSDAKTYTDEEIVKMQESSSVACDEKPVYDSETDTVTYKQNGETKTEENTTSWFYYRDEDGNAIQTRWINEVEFTIDVGSIDLSDYVNKTTDVTGTFEENPTDLTKIPNLAYMSALRTAIVTALGKKVNTEDIVDNLLSEDATKPLSANQGKVLDEKITELAETVSGKVSIQQNVEQAGKIVAVGEDGKLTLIEGSDTAEAVSYKHDEHTTWTTVKKALDGLISKVYYIAPAINSFTSDAQSVYEVGQKISSIVFNWTLNKDVTSQTLTDCTITAEDRTATYDTELSSNKTFTLTVNDGEQSVSKQISIAFRNKAYWGSAAIPDDYDSAFILGLSKSAFATAIKGTYDLTIGNNQYGYLCVPSSFTRISSWYIGGFEVDLVDEGTISLTNASGGIAEYRIYHTTQPSLGSIKIEIK